MKSKIALTLCIGMLALSTAACQNQLNTASPATDADEPVTVIPFNTEPSAETQDRFAISENRFYETATTRYNLS